MAKLMAKLKVEHVLRLNGPPLWRNNINLNYHAFSYNLEEL
jgi:hypothetical protein